jgi:hypothetical protein
MRKSDTFTCDECGVLRDGAAWSEPWWIVNRFGSRSPNLGRSDGRAGPGLTIVPLDGYETVIDGQHYCGAECVGKVVSRFLSDAQRAQ